MKSQVGQLFSLGVIYSLGGLLEKGVHFVFLPVYTYYLDPTEYGIIAMMMLAVNLICPVFQVPTAAGVQRYYYAPGYRRINDELVFLGFASILWQGIIFSILFFIFSNWISTFLLEGAAYAPVVRVFALVLLCEPLSQYLSMLLRLQKKAYPFILISSSSAVFFSLLMIYLLVEKNLGYMALAYGRLFHPAYTLILGFCVLFKGMKISFHLSHLKPLLSYGFPLVIPSLSFFLINSSDRFVLKIFFPLEVVGLFVFVSQFTLIYKTIVVFPIKNALTPIVLESEGDPDHIRKFLHRSATYFCLFSFFIWLCLTLFSKELIQVMARDPSYWSGWSLLPILTLSSVILGLDPYFNAGIILAKKTSLITFNYLVGCATNIALNFLLIPPWGAMGAAVATCMSLVLLVALDLFYSHRLYRLAYDFRKIGLTALCAGLLAVIGIAANSFGVLTAIAVKVLLLAAYPAVLFMARVFSRSELGELKEFVLNSKGGRLIVPKRFGLKDSK